MPGAAPVLALDGLDKRFGATHALRDVSLALEKGEALGLVGHNGAGKSTLIKIVAGALRPDAGTIAIAGETVALDTPGKAHAAGIRVIHQDAPLVPHFDTVDNCFLGRAYPRRFGLVDRRAMGRAIAAIAEEIAPDLPLDRPVALLSASQRQFVRLVRALLDDGRILILDEPTAALSAEESARFFEVLARVRARGTAIILVTHRLDEIAGFCSRAVVMIDGAVAQEVAGDEVTPANLVTAMGGSAEAGAIAAARPASPCVLRLDRVTTRGLATPASLSVAQGEIVALYGLVGSGRTELLDTIWGCARVTGGTMTLDGKPYAPRGPADAVAAQISYVPADRHRTGLFASQSLLFNATLPLLKRFRAVPWLAVPDGRREGAAFARAAQAVGLVHAHPGQAARTLSGGNQQKLIFSRWAHRHSKAMLLDEPTEGVDILAKAALRTIIREMAADGNAVIVSTSDRDEALALGDRIVVFRAGAIVADLTRAQASPAALSAAAQSRDIPAA